MNRFPTHEKEFIKLGSIKTGHSDDGFYNELVYCTFYSLLINLKGIDVSDDGLNKWFIYILQKTVLRYEKYLKDLNGIYKHHQNLFRKEIEKSPEDIDIFLNVAVPHRFFDEYFLLSSYINEIDADARSFKLLQLYFRKFEKIVKPTIRRKETKPKQPHQHTASNGIKIQKYIKQQMDKGYTRNKAYDLAAENFGLSKTYIPDIDKKPFSLKK